MSLKEKVQFFKELSIPSTVKPNCPKMTTKAITKVRFCYSKGVKCSNGYDTKVGCRSIEGLYEGVNKQDFTVQRCIFIKNVLLQSFSCVCLFDHLKTLKRARECDLAQRPAGLCEWLARRSAWTGATRATASGWRRSSKSRSDSANDRWTNGQTDRRFSCLKS